MTVLEYLEFTNKKNDAYQVRDRITCNDGFTVSVQGGTELHYCSPRRKCNQYKEVELGYPSSEDELIQQYAENPEYPTETVYPFVPIDIVEKLIEKHGGINK